MKKETMDLLKVNVINSLALVGALNVQDIYYMFGAFMLLTVGVFNIFKIIELHRNRKK